MKIASISQFAARLFDSLPPFGGAAFLTALIVLMPLQFILCELVWSPRYWKWVSVFIVLFLSIPINFTIAMGLQIELPVRFEGATATDLTDDVIFQQVFESTGIIMVLLVPVTFAAIIYRWRRVPKHDSTSGVSA